MKHRSTCSAEVLDRVVTTRAHTLKLVSIVPMREGEPLDLTDGFRTCAARIVRVADDPELAAKVAREIPMGTGIFASRPRAYAVDIEPIEVT